MTENTDVHRMLYDALTADVIQPGYPGLWDGAVPYLLRNAARHAVDAGRLDELLTDPEFLVHADPVTLARYLHHAESPDARRAASIHRASYVRHHKTDPETRRQILAVDAARFGETQWARNLMDGSPWRIAWATGGQASPALAATFTDHPDVPRAVVCTPVDDRATAIVAGGGEDAYLWDLMTGEITGVLTGHSDRINAVAFGQLGGRQDGGRLVAATASGDGTVRVWDLTNMTTVTTFNAGDDLNAVTLATAHHEDVVIAGGSDETVTVWELRTGRVRFTYREHDSVISGIATAVLDEVPVVVTCSNDGSARVWSLLTGQTITIYEGHRMYSDGDVRNWVRGVAVSMLDHVPVAVTIGNDDSDHVWELGTGRRRTTYAAHRRDADSDGRIRPNAVATIEPNGRAAVVTGSPDGTAHVWDLATGQTLIILAGHTERVTSIGWTPLYDGLAAVTTSEDGTVRVWDLMAGLEYGAVPESASHAGRVRAVTLTEADGVPAVASASADTTAIIWDLTTGAPRERLAGHSRGVNGAAACTIADQPVLVTVSDDQTMLRWDLAQQRRETSPALMGEFDDPVTAVACALMSGRTLAVAASNDKLRVWDLATGEPWTSGRTSHTTPINAMACAELKGEPVIVRGSNDVMAEVWNPTVGVSIRSLTGHDGPVSAVACIVIDEQAVAVTGSADGSVRVHDLSGTSSSEVLVTHDGPVRAVACAVLGDRGVVLSASGFSVYVSDIVTRRELGSFAFPYEVNALCANAVGEIVVATGHEIVCMVWSDPREDREQP
jgi:WD40 repeat protein